MDESVPGKELPTLSLYNLKKSSPTMLMVHKYFTVFGMWNLDLHLLLNRETVSSAHVYPVVF